MSDNKNTLQGFRKPTALDELRTPAKEQSTLESVLSEAHKKFEFQTDKVNTANAAVAEKPVQAARESAKTSPTATQVASASYDALGNATGMESASVESSAKKAPSQPAAKPAQTQVASSEAYDALGNATGMSGDSAKVEKMAAPVQQATVKAPEVKTVVASSASEKVNTEYPHTKETSSKVQPFTKAHQNEILAQANAALATEQAQEALKEANIALAAEREKARAALGVPVLKAEIAPDSPSERLADNIKNSPVLAELNKSLTQEGVTPEQKKMLQEQIANTPETVSFKGEMLSLAQAEQKLQVLKKEDLQEAATQLSAAFQELGYNPTTVKTSAGQLYVVDKEVLNQTIVAQGLDKEATKDFKITLLDSRTGKETALEGKTPEELSVQTLEVIKSLPQGQGMVAGVTNLRDKEVTVVYGDDATKFKEAFEVKTAQAEQALEELNNPQKVAAQSSVAQAISAMALTDTQGQLASPGKLFKSEDGIQYHEATANLVERVMNEAIAKINPDEKLIGREKLVVTEALLRGDGAPIQVMDKQGHAHEIDAELVKHLQKVVKTLNEPQAAQVAENHAVKTTPVAPEQSVTAPAKASEQVAAATPANAENSNVQVNAIKQPEMERARELPHG